MGNHPYGPWSSSLGSIVNTNVLRTNQYKNDYGTYTDSSVTAMLLGEANSRSGFNSGSDHSTPRSASCVKDIRTLVRPWNAYAWTRSNGATWYKTLSSGWRPGETSGSFDDPNVQNVGLTISQVKDLAFKKFIGKQGSDFSGLVFAGESKEMVETCQDILNRATGAHNDAYQSLVKNLSKRKKGSVQALAREIADHNLGLQFAILPSITDLKNLALSYQSKVINDDFKPRTIQASYAERASAAKQYSVNYVFQCQLDNQCRWERIAKVGAELRQDIPDKPDWVNNLDYFGFSPNMIVPALWELTPYSWLADYFVNVGDLLELAALRRGMFKNGWSVTIDQFKFFSYCTPTKYNNGTSYSLLKTKQAGLYTREYFNFQRSPFDPDAYVPSLRVRIPSLQQSANVLSLATKKFIRSPINQVLPARVGKKVGMEVSRILHGR